MTSKHSEIFYWFKSSSFKLNFYLSSLVFIRTFCWDSLPAKCIHLLVSLPCSPCQPSVFLRFGLCSSQWRPCGPPSLSLGSPQKATDCHAIWATSNKISMGLVRGTSHWKPRETDSTAFDFFLIFKRRFSGFFCGSFCLLPVFFIFWGFPVSCSCSCVLFMLFRSQPTFA